MKLDEAKRILGFNINRRVDEITVQEVVESYRTKSQELIKNTDYSNPIERCITEQNLEKLGIARDYLLEYLEERQKSKKDIIIEEKITSFIELLNDLYVKHTGETNELITEEQTVKIRKKVTDIVKSFESIGREIESSKYYKLFAECAMKIRTELAEYARKYCASHNLDFNFDGKEYITVDGTKKSLVCSIEELKSFLDNITSKDNKNNQTEVKETKEYEYDEINLKVSELEAIYLNSYDDIDKNLDKKYRGLYYVVSDLISDFREEAIEHENDLDYLYDLYQRLIDEAINMFINDYCKNNHLDYIRYDNGYVIKGIKITAKDGIFVIIDKLHSLPNEINFDDISKRFETLIENAFNIGDKTKDIAKEGLKRVLKKFK